MTNDTPIPEVVQQPANIAESIAKAVQEATKDGGRAEVRINPNVAIPPHIAGNLLEFLRRVKSEGMEAIAWVEAYTFVQQHVPAQGVQFTGLPQKK